MTEGTMTFQDHAIADETASIADPPPTYWTDRLLQPGIPSEQDHVPAHADPNLPVGPVEIADDFHRPQLLSA